MKITTEMAAHIAALSRLKLSEEEAGRMAGELEQILSYMDVLSKNLGVMDMTAASFCRDRNIPFLVFSIEDPQNIVRAVAGEKVGTLVE